MPYSQTLSFACPIDFAGDGEIVCTEYCIALALVVHSLHSHPSVTSSLSPLTSKLYSVLTGHLCHLTCVIQSVPPNLCHATRPGFQILLFHEPVLPLASDS